MADGDELKEFPDVLQKLAAPKKLSAFEKERQLAEEKKKRAEAENAAALKEFEDSFNKDTHDNDDLDGFPRFRAPPAGPRGGLGGARGNYGGPLSAPHSGPGSRGPGAGAIPPSLKRKRALDELREAQEARREQEALADEYMGRGPGRDAQFSSAQEDDRDDIAPKPTVQLSSLPPSMTGDDVKLLLRPHLSVHSLRFQPPTGAGSLGKKSMTAIATLSSESSTAEIDAAISALKDKYLGAGFHLSISRHLSSTSMLPAVFSAPSPGSAAPFGAQKVDKDQQDRFNMRNAPPPNQFAPPDSYHARGQATVSADATILVQPPSRISTVRAVHTVVDRLLSEVNPYRALKIEAMLMALPEVRRDERLSFLYDSKVPAGSYYRFLLWNDNDSYEAVQERKGLAKGPERIIDDLFIDWMPPYEEVPFADLSSLGQVLEHPNYESSGEESDDGEERRFNTGRREGEGLTETSEKKYLTPLQMAKFVWLLSRMPPTQALLRKGDVAAVTTFAINHAGAGAEEIVDMMVLNVEKSFTSTQCAEFDDSDISQDEDDVYEPDQELPTVEAMDDPAKAEEKKDAEDPSQAKLVALYLISDVLHNSSTAGVRNAWKYRQLFENAFRRQKTFEHLGQLEKTLGWGKMKADKWRMRIRVLFEIWERESIFASDVFEALNKDFFEQPVVEEPREKSIKRLKRVDVTVSPASPASPASAPLATKATAATAHTDNIPLGEMGRVPVREPRKAALDDPDAPTTEDAAMTDAPSEELQGEPASSDAKTGFPVQDASVSNISTQATPRAGQRMQAEDMFADSDEE